jgi:D-glycero-D-manno-heptose 1,7-bisphosphate phosphatase
VAGILFLDRDGVLNEKAPEGAYITSVGQLRLLPGVGAALAEVRRTLPHVPVVVVTNQRGIARGMVTREVVDEIDERLRELVREAGGDLDGFEVCPHDIGACDCRKPALGLFRRALARYAQASGAHSVMVGDSLSDVQAGAALGAHTALIGEVSHRVRVRAAAARGGLRIDAEAGSLADLVASGRLIGWLDEPRVMA